MIVHQPTRTAIFSAAMAAINAALAAALGSWALSAVFIAVVIGSMLVYRDAKAKPLAQLTAGILRLQSRTLSVGLDVAAIEGWQRSGKLLAIRARDLGGVVVGPYWTERPVRELERALEQAFPEKR